MNQFQAVLEVMRPLPLQSMRLGAACGLALTLLAGESPWIAYCPLLSGL